MIPSAFRSRIRALRKKPPWPRFVTAGSMEEAARLAYNTALEQVEEALGEGDAVLVRLTPSQAGAILLNMKEGPGLNWGRKWRSIHNGAETRVRNALIDAGWRDDGEYWVKDG